MTMFFHPRLISSYLSSLALSFPLFLAFYSSLFTPLFFPPVFFLLFLCPSHFFSSFVFSFLVSLFLPTKTSYFLSYLLLDCFLFFFFSLSPFLQSPFYATAGHLSPKRKRCSVFSACCTPVSNMLFRVSLYSLFKDCIFNNC